MDEEQYKAYQERLSSRVAMASSIRPGANVKRAGSKGRNKYGAEPTTVDGMRFDSKAEAKRYIQLSLLQKVGDITDLQTQVSFDLIPAQEVEGVKERPVRYFADFSYVTKDGLKVVEDVKSGPTKTKEFILKRKLVMWIHGVVVKEVLMP